MLVLAAIIVPLKSNNAVINVVFVESAGPSLSAIPNRVIVFRPVNWSNPNNELLDTIVTLDVGVAVVVSFVSGSSGGTSAGGGTSAVALSSVVGTIGSVVSLSDGTNGGTSIGTVAFVAFVKVVAFVIFCASTLRKVTAAGEINRVNAKKKEIATGFDCICIIKVSPILYLN